MEVTSSWTTGQVLELAQEAHAREVHVFLPQKLTLCKCKEDLSCTVTIMFPTTLKLLDVTIDSSARHVEVYIITVSPTGERQPRYVDTVRGVKSGTDVFHVPYAFSNTEDMQVASGVSFKFVSLQPTHTKDVLTLSELKVRVHPPPAAPTPPPQLSTATPDVASRPSPPPIDMDTMKMILSMQQAMQKQMEDKIYKAVDSRLSLLTTRLQSTESKILALTNNVPQAEVNHDKESFAGILKRLASLEKEVRGMKACHDSGELATALQQLQTTANLQDGDDVATLGESDDLDDGALATATSSTAVDS
ncbi:hypothetical protein, variant [Aphanomyces astaci]|uniref:Uncharacterized protein n=1 Tax=Aphanomyces astaci TaxID=112090 RepID=W4H0K3_APHAT|nr:hypothetical protein, variant [Aphanomyces astaci]ETV85535.1 hypothetical protein, variant [Aphanomyces astaci]|eukprot:XP_009825553.1 hypothetical protein, variant [Aphanomyces astaci]